MPFLFCIAILFITTVNRSSGQKCTLKTTFNPHKVKSGNTISLICQATMGKTADQLIWLKDHKKIYHNNYITNLTSSTLNLINVTLKDSGKYECRIKENVICSRDLQVYAPPKASICTARSPVKFISTKHTLSCCATGYPTPALIWVFKNRIIDNERGDWFHTYSEGVETKRLVIVGAAALSGTYSCVAKNSEGQDRIDTLVKFEVFHAPVFEMRSKIYVARINQTLTLQCLVKNVYLKSMYRLNWYHNTTDGPVDLPNHKTIFLKEKRGIMKSNVTIANITRADAGFYFCKVKRKTTEEEYQLKHTLVVAQPGLPSVTLNRYQFFKAEGERVTLVCKGHYSRYDMEDRAQLFWIKDGLTLGSESKYSISSNELITGNAQQVESRLTIKKLVANDAGNYTCATMSAVKNTSVSGYVSIDSPRQVKDHFSSLEVSMLVVAICLLAGLATGVLLRYMKRKKSLRRHSKGYGNYLYETFLTYSTKDYDWIKSKLIPLLEKYLVKYCIPHRDFEPGKALIENITDSIYQSRTVIAVISKNYMSSKKCQDELDVALYRVAERNENSLIVIRVDSIEKSQLPKALRNRTFLDYMDKEEKRHWERRLLKQLFREHETSHLVETS